MPVARAQTRRSTSARPSARIWRITTVPVARSATDRDRDVHIDTQTDNDVPVRSGRLRGGPVGVFRATRSSVRSFPPNRFGLYEMHGNVWGTLRRHRSSGRLSRVASGRPLDIGPQPDRILRGGSWSQNPAICRSAYRDSMGVRLQRLAGARRPARRVRARRGWVGVELVPLSPGTLCCEGSRTRAAHHHHHHHRRHQARVRASEGWGFESLRARSRNHLGEAAGKLVTLLTDRRT